MNKYEFREFCIELYTKNPQIIEKWQLSDDVMERAYAMLIREYISQEA